MFFGKVIGTIWATKKYPALNGMKMQIVQPLNGELVKTGEPFIAIDTVGAGPGETILYITATEAVIPLPVEMAPVDASIVGIVDRIDISN